MIAQPPLLTRRGDGFAVRVFLLACLLLFPSLAFADYRTYEIESLRITVDTDWPTVGTVGYFPIRLDITNLADDAREIEVAVSINHYFDPSRRRGAAGVRTSFSRADMGRSDVGQRVALKRGDRKRFTLPIPVLADSERITLAFREDGRNLDSSTAFTFQSGRTLPETPLVVVSSASSTLAATVGLRPMVVYRPSYMSPSPVPASGVTPRMDITLDPSRLPRNWLGYTALRAVLLGPTEWKELEPDQQDALLMWTAVGGDLIFADGSLDMLLPPGQTPVGLKKTDAVPWYFGNIHLLKSADIREKGLVDTISFLDSAVATPDWSLPTIRSSDWGWMGARNFRVPIEGVGYVPIRQYLLILALFVALIGPINYIYLWRRGRQVLLVLTVPLISAAFILLLTGYGVLSQGFDIRARAVTFTVLDQNAKKAATRASVSLFPGGISRSSGVRFASDTGVISLGNDGLGARELTLDLTGEQRYTSGFLRPRTPGNFEQVWFQPARQRLNFERNGEQVSVVNGLGTTLKQLYYLEGGAVTYALDRPLAAGERASMKTSDQSMPGLVNAIRDGIKETPISPGKFQHVLTYRPEGAYLAVLEASPFWEPGLEKPREIGSLHVVLGFAGGQP